MPPKQKAPKRARLPGSSLAGTIQREPDGSLSQDSPSEPPQQQQPAKKDKKEKLECPERGPDGKLYFMLKQKPEVLSVEAMEGAPNQTVRVKDIKSYASRKIVQSMQEGDEVLLYQTVKPNSKEQPGLTGLCCVASAPYPDPTDGKWLAFDLRLEEPFDKRITLNNMKKYEKAELRGATLFTNQMLQVHWLTPEQFDFLLEIPDEE